MRILTRGGNVEEHSVAEACSEQLVSVSPDDDIDRAVALMRQHAVRRLLITEGSRPVGIVALGDLAVERAPTPPSPTSAPPNPTNSHHARAFSADACRPRGPADPLPDHRPAATMRCAGPALSTGPADGSAQHLIEGVATMKETPHSCR